MKSQTFAAHWLPAVLTESEEFSALTAEQRKGLIGRLLDTHELIELSAHGATATQDAFRRALLDIELDALAVTGVGESPDKTVSGWVIHDSWTFECSNSRLADFVNPAVLTAAEASSVTVNSSAEEVSTWLRQWSIALQATFNSLSTASTFCGAIAQLIAIDMLCASLVFRISLLHLSGLLNRR
jgi:hypothetical protein